MRKAEFKQYLMENGYGKKTKYAESTAEERTGCCEKIEKEFCKNLDIVALDASAKAARFVPMNGGFFYRLATDMPPKSCYDMLNGLEDHYETIMGWGRDLLRLSDKCDHIERIPVVLDPAIKKKTYNADENYWSRKIYELNRKKNGDISQEEILRILKKKTFKDRITGEFVERDNQIGPHIILYYNAIAGKALEEKIANFANVLAHEYMHYMEYRYCSAMGVKHYRNENLSEALADFFGVLYTIKFSGNGFCSAQCGKKFIKVAAIRYKAWVERFDSCWPYAHALYFYTVGGYSMVFSHDYTKYQAHGSVEKLIEVFNKCVQPDDAYAVLKNK